MSRAGIVPGALAVASLLAARPAPASGPSPIGAVDLILASGSCTPGTSCPPPSWPPDLRASVVWSVPGWKMSQECILDFIDGSHAYLEVPAPPASMLVPLSLQGEDDEELFGGLPANSPTAAGRVLLYHDGNANGDLDLGLPFTPSPDGVLAGPDKLKVMYSWSGGAGAYWFPNLTEDPVNGQEPVMLSLSGSERLDRLACAETATGSPDTTEMIEGPDGEDMAAWCAEGGGACANHYCEAPFEQATTIAYTPPLATPPPQSPPSEWQVFDPDG